MTSSIRLAHRALLSVHGPDASNLLQGLITNDLRRIGNDQGIAAFMLNTKGRIVDDLLVFKKNEEYLVECSADGQDELKKLLEKYRMRKKASIEPSTKSVFFSTSSGIQDPRFPSFGFRNYDDSSRIDNPSTYLSKRLELGIAEGKDEVGGMLPFQANGDFLNFVSLDKGCYIGQELTARTAHTGVIRRRVMPFKHNLPLSDNEEIIRDSKNTKIGKVIRRTSDFGIAVFPIEAVLKKDKFKINDSIIEPFIPSWMNLKANSVD